MSIESLILDLTTAVRENTDSNNKLLLVMQGNEPVVAVGESARDVEADKKQEAAKAKAEAAAEKKEKAATAKKEKAEAAKKAKAEEEAAEEPEVEEEPEEEPEVEEKPAAKKSDDSDSDQVATLYKMMQERLISLVSKYEEDGDLSPKEAHAKAVAFMKEKTGCTRLDKVDVEQYEIFIDELEEELS